MRKRERLRSIMFVVGGSFKETSCCFRKKVQGYKRMKNRMRLKSWNSLVHLWKTLTFLDEPIVKECIWALSLQLSLNLMLILKSFRFILPPQLGMHLLLEYYYALVTQVFWISNNELHLCWISDLITQLSYYNRFYYQSYLIFNIEIEL